MSKGSSPRNLSKKFRDNYSEINWGKPSKRKAIKKQVAKTFHIVKNLAATLF